MSEAKEKLERKDELPKPTNIEKIFTYWVPMLTIVFVVISLLFLLFANPIVDYYVGKDKCSCRGNIQPITHYV